MELSYHSIHEGENWGKIWNCGWFHVTGQVPEDWTGNVVLDLNFGGEACLFDADGCPFYGLSDGSVFQTDYEKNFYPIFPQAKGKEKIDLWVDARANRSFGVTPCYDPKWVGNDPSLIHLSASFFS